MRPVIDAYGRGLQGPCWVGCCPVRCGHQPLPTRRTSRLEDAPVHRRPREASGGRLCSAGSARRLGGPRLVCTALDWQGLPRRRCVKSSNSAQPRPLLQSYPSTTEAEPAENCSHGAHLCQPGPASHRSTRRRPPAPQAEPAPETWRAHHQGRTNKKNGHAQPARRRRAKTN